MSIGSPHRIDIDDALLPGALRRFLKLKADHADLRRALDADYSVSYRFDMPYSFGYNTSRTRYYGDRDIPHVARLRTTDGKAKSFHIVPFALEHEIVESALQSILGMDHESAHHMATASEYDRVHRAGIDLPSYRKWFAQWIKADIIRDERMPLARLRIPPDLDLTPFLADDSPDGSILLQRVRTAMRRNGRSAANWGFQRSHSRRGARP